MSNTNVKCFKYGKYGHSASECYPDKCFSCGEVRNFAKKCSFGDKKGETTNLLTKNVKDEAILLMVVHNSGTEHNRVENSTR